MIRVRHAHPNDRAAWLESMLGRRGAGVVIANTANHRADAHAFYESRGYSFTGRRYRKALTS